MRYRIFFHPLAEMEYSEAYLWYEERMTGLGDRFAQAIEKQLTQITSRPLLFPKKSGNFREAKADTFPYIIVYKVYNKTKTIFISAIFHTSRSPRKKYRK